MAKETITLEWEGVLRMGVVEIIGLHRSDQPAAFGIAARALVSPSAAPIPIELVLTPTQAAAILEMLRDFAREGDLPTPPLRVRRHRRH